MWTTEQIDATQKHVETIRKSLKTYESTATELAQSLEECKQAKSEKEQKARRADVLEVLYKLDQINHKQKRLFNGFELFNQVGFYFYNREDEKA